MSERNDAPEDDDWYPDIAGAFAQNCAPDIERLLSPFFQDRARTPWEAFGTLGGRASEPDKATELTTKAECRARAEAEKTAMVARLSQEMGSLYELLHQSTQDPAAFFEALAIHARMHKRRGRPRGATNPERDAWILAAGDAAPEGQKEAAIAAAVGARTAKESAAALKKYFRLVAERKRDEKALAEWDLALAPTNGALDK
jgi:hypothetical protein